LRESFVAVRAQPNAFYNPYAPNLSSLDFKIEGGSDFLFADDHTKKRTWGEKIFYATGGSYLVGMQAGGPDHLYTIRFGAAKSLSNGTRMV
jgi:hypothetical protein